MAKVGARGHLLHSLLRPLGKADHTPPQYQVQASANTMLAQEDHLTKWTQKAAASGHPGINLRPGLTRSNTFL